MKNNREVGGYVKQLLFILNPVAGMKKASKQLIEIIATFNRAEYDTHVYVTSCQKDATNAVKTFGKNCDLIVCCGGDGTLNETVTGVLETGIEVPIGYIPAGSTNDFANSLSLQSDVVKAAQQIVNGNIIEYDIGKFTDRYFTYIASFGVFTKASYTTPQNVKNTLGHMAYVLEGMQELSNIHTEHIRMEADGEVLEDDYLFGAICNSVSVGGVLKLASEYVDMSDGKFEILLVRKPKDIQELHECILALSNKEYNCRMITFRSVKKIRISSNPDMIWSLDGERVVGAEEICIENIHNGIRLVH